VQAERLARDFETEFDWRPFELHPETPPSGIPLDSSRLSPLAVAYWERLASMARELGLAFQRPSLIANSHLALEAGEFVREHAPGRFEAFHRAVFAAYFERSLDIGDAARLVELAAACGVPDEALRDALADRRYERAVDDSTDEARAHGVSGTPTFVFDGRLPIVGAQDYAVFESVARRMGARPRRLPLA
jgi:predicted DsbA family dithiol-disulfide isomerase